MATQPIMCVAPQAATLEAYRDQIATWIDHDHLLVTRVQELLGQNGVPVAQVWRWIDEPTTGGLNLTRRLSKDYEVLPASSEAFLCLATSSIMLGRLS